MDIDGELVGRARGGDPVALEEVIRAAKDLVYNLAIRMLGNPTDAEDATQEILLKVVTNLGSFRGDSAFRTWAYRVASNYLLNVRKRGAELRIESFEQLGAALGANLDSGDPPVEDQALASEARLICTSTMLACLDRDHRLAFILGEIFELASEEGAAIIEIAPDAFRKRLNRARDRMAQFMGQTCGLVDDKHPCRCNKQAAHAIRVGFVDPMRLVWSLHARKPDTRQARVDTLDQLSRAIELFRSHPTYIAPADLIDRVRRALDSSDSDLLR
jgi:RNA polymerase sigma factor (sigma-70 family)